MNNLVNEEQIQKCLQHVEDSNKFRKLLSQLKISTELISYDKYFEDDKDDRNIYRVTIIRRPPKNGKDVFSKRISFKFGDSLSNTQEGNEPDLYSVLTTVDLQYEVPATFEDFCDQFGYEIDSRKAERLFKASKKLSEKLHKIFTDDDVYSEGVSVFPH